MELSERQRKMVKIVKENEPITGEQIADYLQLSRATLRPDLAILTMAGYLDARPRVGYFYSGKAEQVLLSDKMNQLRIKQYQSHPVLVKENETVYDAISAMFLGDVGTLFVINEDHCLTGVLSRKDLLRASLGNQDLNAIPVHIIMTRMPNITVCYQDDLLLEGAKLLIDKQIDGLPVVKDSEKGLQVVGRITKTTITQAFVEVFLQDEI